jgi:hypothetical protein
MNCRRAVRLADDYLDCLLAPRRTASFEAHLAACPSCRRILEETAALRARTAALPRSFAPEGELWSSIRDRLSEGRLRPAPHFRLRRLAPLGAAAGALVVLLFAFFALRPASSPAVIGAEHPAVTLKDFRNIDADYRQARETLMLALASGLNGIDPRLVDLVKTNLSAVDRAVEEIESALKKYPEESGLLMLLAAANSRRLDVLAAAQKHLIDL